MVDRDAPPPEALVITGATATGKTAVAVHVARRLDGEIISMDSRQLYRGMDIGTAKPALDERAGIVHHGFDLVPPDERFSAGRFADLARGWLAEIHARGRAPLLVGGTGFFLRALTHPLFQEPPLDAGLREQWKQYLESVDAPSLARWAAALDPAATVRPGDRQRLARIIEMASLTGRPLSWWHQHAPPALPPLRAAVFVLDLPRELLHRKIDERVGAMMTAGLADEVRGLLAAGYAAGDPGMNATGYLEVVGAVQGEYPMQHAADLVRGATRRYARRQLTWLRNQLPAGAHWLDARQDAATLAEQIVDVWRREGNR
jgi:tRNA dimethylallyltransferase